MLWANILPNNHRNHNLLEKISICLFPGVSNSNPLSNLFDGEGLLGNTALAGQLPLHDGADVHFFEAHTEFFSKIMLAYKIKSI